MFSNKVYSDSTLSRYFTNELTSLMHTEFRIQWIKRCIKKGMKNIWVCIDGSNNDCQMSDSDYAEFGDNKSHSGKTIVGFIYAVDSVTGEPVTYFVNPGGEVDCQVFQDIINFVVGYGLVIEGVILDRGFCTHEVVNTLRTLHLEYVIMAKDAQGSNEMLDRFGEEIFWDPRYLVNNKDVFGISEEVQIWKTHPDRGVINLFFQGWRSYHGNIKLIERVCEAKVNADKYCKQGKKPVIDKDLKKYFDINQDSDGGFSVSYRYDEWKKGLHNQGFFSMLSSKDYSPEKVFKIYQLRMASETQYRILKSQEGFDTTRVHTDKGMMSKYAICFAASILRHTIMSVCIKHDLETNAIIQKCDRIHFMQLEGGEYIFVRKMFKDYRTVISDFSMNIDSFEEIVKSYNRRQSSKIYSQVHEIPRIIPEVRRRGRPPGRKNNKTLEREAVEAEARVKGIYIEPEKKKRGRPVGIKDTKPRKKRSDYGVKRGKRELNSTQ